MPSFRVDFYNQAGPHGVFPGTGLPPYPLALAQVPWGFLSGSVVKKLPGNAGDAGSIPGLGRTPREGNGNPLQYSCLENPMDKGAWWATLHRVAKSQIGLSTHV